MEQKISGSIQTVIMKNTGFEKYRYGCYLFASHQDSYQKDGSFEERLTSLITKGMAFSKEEAIPFLEDMIRHGSAYEKMDEKHCPIMVYVGDPKCYGVIDHFARSFAAALERQGCPVELFNPHGDHVAELADLSGKRFRALIGIQTFAFSVKKKNGENLHDEIKGPKFNMILDHPVWLKEHLEGGPKDYYVLTHDDGYKRFIDTYFPKIKKTFLLPPAGEEYETDHPVKKEYDLSFVGSYHDPRTFEPQAALIDKKTNGLAFGYYEYMLVHPSLSWEDGLSSFLLEDNFKNNETAQKARYSREAFFDLLYDMESVCFMIMSHFREEILDAIAGSGIPMHVFGDTFQTGRYANVKSFIRHGSLSFEESLKVYATSKVSLNIMSWHKEGMTERLANIMMNDAVCVTDTSSYLRREYTAGEDYLEFDLSKPKDVPKLITMILSDKERRIRIIRNAKERSLSKETWDIRAKAFLNLLSEL